MRNGDKKYVFNGNDNSSCLGLDDAGNVVAIFLDGFQDGFEPPKFERPLMRRKKSLLEGGFCYVVSTALALMHRRFMEENRFQDFLDYCVTISMSDLIEQSGVENFLAPQGRRRL